ncbi:hypothetical protein NA57DRAFT_52691 [Rhizodiscina lignyota]|uniref:Uncharacterized protein n=1 Tax=Rhizodiscina lignyota TaxID=1504668 RepID=A0A9P4IKC3_9PEZI|nr:hypothetical protein NA57DRAFT_52691 [Rhizodiscina lignyota]
MAILLSALLFSLLGTAFAAPAPQQSGTVAPQPTEPIIITFNLVSTNVSSPDSIQPSLDDDRALIMFDPLHQDDLLLRTASNYNLPIFKLEGGSLHVKAPGPFGGADRWYASQKLVENQPITFAHKPNGNSGFSWNGPLISVGEFSGLFTLCKGPLGEDVIFWKGTDASCSMSFMQAIPRSEVL